MYSGSSFSSSPVIVSVQLVRESVTSKWTSGEGECDELSLHERSRDLQGGAERWR